MRPEWPHGLFASVFKDRVQFIAAAQGRQVYGTYQTQHSVLPVAPFLARHRISWLGPAVDMVIGSLWQTTIDIRSWRLDAGTVANLHRLHAREP